MITLPRVAIALLLLVVGYVFLLAPRLAPPSNVDGARVVLSLPPSPPPGTTPREFPKPGSDFFGAFTKAGPANFADLDRFVAAAGRSPQVMLFAQGWLGQRFDRRPFDAIVNRSMLPIMGWEPWDYQQEPKKEALRAVQPRYQLSRITAGDFDPYLRDWASGIARLGYPIGIRFAHEMNGNWYPWAEQVNGNNNGDYVRAWRHVHDIFRAAGANNVIWIWSPNVTFPGADPISPLYPGDEYVDWVGLSGYYGTAGMQDYQSFADIYQQTFTELHTFTAKPIVITEVAATDTAGRKAEWIRDFLATLPRFPFVIGFIWYEGIKETDWRVTSSAEVSRAFAQGVAQPYFDASWSPYSVPLRSVGTGDPTGTADPAGTAPPSPTTS